MACIGWSAHQEGAPSQVELEALRGQARALQSENAELRAEALRLELRDGQLQGYGLDSMANEQLAGLILTLTQVFVAVLLGQKCCWPP